MKYLKIAVELLNAIYQLLKIQIEHKQLCEHCRQDDTWLDKWEVMDYLRITESTYYRWIQKGVIQPRGGSGQHRFFKNDLHQLFEKRKHRERGVQ
ncbi:MAG TPA: helix-turn-helix domain-containing protein [Pseudosphingobacterium sp.]|nr:helix-turn-helix domain-containing protein [Pseudosphingobacterium sp.]